MSSFNLEETFQTESLHKTFIYYENLESHLEIAMLFDSVTTTSSSA